MATSLDKLFGLGFDALSGVGGESVSIGNATYRAIVGEIDQRDEIAEGGVRQIRSVRFAIRASDLASIPAIWDRVTVRAQTLQIMSVTQDNAVVEFTAGGLAE
jgi:hypothetical protein